MILCKRCGKEIKTECLDCIAEAIKQARAASESELEEARELAQKIQFEAIEAIIVYLQKKDGNKE